MSRMVIFNCTLSIILLCFVTPTLGQQPLIFGKYSYRTEVGEASIKYSFYTEYKLELRVDSQYVLEKFIYHTSKPGLKSKFELIESNKHRGSWMIKDDLLFLKRISMQIEMKESSLVNPSWVELDIRDWEKKKGYFIFRSKPKT